MNKRARYENRFGCPFDSWTQAQMREALEALLPARSNAGRPKKDEVKLVCMNYAALKFWIDELRASPKGAKMSPKKALNEVVLQSLKEREAAHARLLEDLPRLLEELRAARAAGDDEQVRVLEILTRKFKAPKDVTRAFYVTAERGLRKVSKNTMAKLFGTAAV